MTNDEAATSAEMTHDNVFEKPEGRPHSSPRTVFFFLSFAVAVLCQLAYRQASNFQDWKLCQLEGVFFHDSGMTIPAGSLVWALPFAERWLFLPYWRGWEITPATR